MDDECHKNYMKEVEMQKECDDKLLAELKVRFPKEIMDNVCNEINECSASNYRIVDEPIGEKQEWSEYDTWVVQHCGCCEDDYYGTVCMRLSDTEYIKWEFND